MEVKLTDGNVITGEYGSFDSAGVWLEDAKLEDHKEKQTLTLGEKVFVPFSNILYIVK
jgi:small nuclear ribonucleoprotein (snRNP)-like protein